MYKQVIVVNKSLNMSPGKLGAMVAHGATSFFCEWFKRNVATSAEKIDPITGELNLYGYEEKMSMEWEN